MIDVLMKPEGEGKAQRWMWELNADGYDEQL
jgi:hypothetical protein